MAYNYYPTYQTSFYPQYSNTQMPSMQQPQIQNGGLVSVRSIQEAFNYPIAPGNSVMFKDECAPFIYTKTKGFSQLDEPIFEKYRLVKEDGSQMPSAVPQSDSNLGGNNPADYALKSDLEALQTALTQQIVNMQKQIDSATKKQSRTVKKEDEPNAN